MVEGGRGGLGERDGSWRQFERLLEQSAAGRNSALATHMLIAHISDTPHDFRAEDYYDACELSDEDKKDIMDRVRLLIPRSSALNPLGFLLRKSDNSVLVLEYPFKGNPDIRRWRKVMEIEWE